MLRCWKNGSFRVDRSDALGIVLDRVVPARQIADQLVWATDRQTLVDS